MNAKREDHYNNWSTSRNLCNAINSLYELSYDYNNQYVKCIAGKCSGGCTPNILTVHFNIPRSNAWVWSDEWE